MTVIPVYVVVLERILLLDVAGPLEVLRAANREQEKLQFIVHYVGPKDAIVSSIGMTVAKIEALPKVLPEGAMLIIPGDVDFLMTPHGVTAPAKDEAGEGVVVRWLKSVVRPGHRVVSICAGALLAGRAGLLDGYSCTTHHLSCAELAEVAPKARVLENRLFVEDGERYSSAGVTAGIDLTLHLVAQLVDVALAVSVARYLVVYLRRSGSDPQLSPWLDGRNHIHPAVHRVQDAIAADPAKSWNLRTLARIAGASSRHLTRLFQECAGMSITEYKNGLRVALARQLITQTSLDMEQVAERSGFGSTRQLRRAWSRLHETAPSHARNHAAVG
jgi:transcriptional regulator GlxA family with amidase domain